MDDEIHFFIDEQTKRLVQQMEEHKTRIRDKAKR
jgi:hypothetical protein